MPDSICLLDQNDSYARKVVEQSNRLAELKSFLGEEITDKIEEYAKSPISHGRYKFISAVSTLLGIGAGATISIRCSKTIPRRQFLENIGAGSLIGGILGYFSPGIFFGLQHKANFTHFINEELPAMYPLKRKEIIEYTQLKYPPITL